MNGVHQFPSLEQVEREASDWIARLHADDLTDAERERFEQWRGAHPRHARTYEELRRTWREFSSASGLVRAVSFGSAMNSVLVRRPRRHWPAVAAAAAMLALGVAVLLRPAPDTRFQTAPGEQAVVRLPDGSALELNSNSLAHVEFTGHTRVVRLKRGEAFFKVAHERERPFWVVAGNSWVRAVGTAFNVSIRASDVRVVVSEGVVKVAAEQSATQPPSDAALAEAPVSILRAGQGAQLNARGASIRALASAELARATAWRQGALHFDNRALGEAAEEIGRYTSVQIVVEDPALRRLPIGGTFEPSPAGADAFLTMLREGLGLKVRREGAQRAVVGGD